MVMAGIRIHPQIVLSLPVSSIQGMIPLPLNLVKILREMKLIVPAGTSVYLTVSALLDMESV